MSVCMEMLRCRARWVVWVSALAVPGAVAFAEAPPPADAPPRPPWDRQLYQTLGGKETGTAGLAVSVADKAGADAGSGPNPASGPDDPGTGRTVYVTEMHADTMVELQVGDQIEIALDGNPATGYAWQHLEGVAAVIQPRGAAQFVPYRRVFGSGGTHHFRYAAMAPGETRLHLVYRQPGQTSEPPARAFALRIVVGPTAARVP